MSWTLLKIRCKKNQAEILSDFFLHFGALSVSIEESLAGKKKSTPLFKGKDTKSELWEWCLLKILLRNDQKIREWITSIQSRLGWTKFPEYFLETLADQDWVKTTQNSFKPLKISRKLWITQSFQPPPDPGAINVLIDPGLAFGTGEHETTRLCLSWLSRNLKKGETVLDFGCGSGILGISALKLGASMAVGIDSDPQALLASRENARLNHVKFECFFSEKSPQKTFDVVLANILLNPLKELAPVLSGYVRKKGKIVFSGVLQKQLQELVSSYSPQFLFKPPKTRNEWALLWGNKK